MIKNINIKNSVTYLIFYFSILGVLFLLWLTGKSLLSVIIPVGTISLFLIDSKIKINKSLFYSILVLLFIIIINLLLFDNYEYAYDSIVKGAFLPIFVGLYFSKLKDNPIKNNIVKVLFIMLNIYCFINFFIMLKQVSTPGFMVRARSDITYYLDMITGFVGEKGTHRLSYVYITCIYLNLIHLKSEVKKYRIFAKVFLIFNLLSSLYISAFNDNRTYYILLALSLLPYLALNFKLKNIKKSKLGKFVVAFILILITSLSLYMTTPAVKKFVDENIIDQYVVTTINKLSSSKQNNTESGEERVELLKYAVSNTNLVVGKGIGSIPLTKIESMPMHFGLNDFNVRIYTGGIPYLIIFFVIYYLFYINFFENKNKSLKVFVLLYTVFAAFYTQSYSQIEKTFLITLSMFVISIMYNKSKIINGNNLINNDERS